MANYTVKKNRVANFKECEDIREKTARAKDLFSRNFYLIIEKLYICVEWI